MLLPINQLSLGTHKPSKTCLESLSTFLFPSLVVSLESSFVPPKLFTCIRINIREDKTNNNLNMLVGIFYLVFPFVDHQCTFFRQYRDPFIYKFQAAREGRVYQT